MTAPKSFRFTLEDGVGLVTFERPKTLNSLTFEVYGELRDFLPTLSERADVRAVVITGEGRGFCSGANLSEGPAEDAADIPAGIGMQLDKLYHPLLRKLRDLPLPIVTAVNGPAVGIGMSLALMGDLDWSLGLALPTSQALTILALDEQGNQLDTVSLSGSGMGASVWNAFTWGSGVWGGAVANYEQYRIPWHNNLIFKQMSVQIVGPSTAGLVIGNLYAKYQPLGYMGAHTP